MEAAVGTGLFLAMANPTTTRAWVDRAHGLAGPDPTSGEVGYGHTRSPRHGCHDRGGRTPRPARVHPLAEGGLGLRRLALKAAAGNGASQHVAEANGFRRTGLERQAERLGDGSYDDLVDYDRPRRTTRGSEPPGPGPRHTPRRGVGGARRRLPVDPVHMTSVAGSPGRSTPPAAGTSLRDALIAIGVVMTALVFTEYVVPSRSRASVAAIVDVISVAAFTVTGLVAWHRRPHNLTGRLMVAAALALWAAGMQEDEIEILSAVGS